MTWRASSGNSEESFGSLQSGLIILLFVIYCLLALPLKSYVQPLIVMSVIPFGIIGAVIGHWLMGHPLSFLSSLGLMALMGVVINDSLVLVDYINQQHRAGEKLYDAVRRAGVARFRPVMLTSLTTFFGLVPLLMEPSSTSQVPDTDGDLARLRHFVRNDDHADPDSDEHHDRQRHSTVFQSTSPRPEGQFSGGADLDQETQILNGKVTDVRCNSRQVDIVNAKPFRERCRILIR